MTRLRAFVPTPRQRAAAGLVLLLAACGGSSGNPTHTPPPGGAGLELEVIGRPQEPLGLLESATVAWRASRSVRYTVELRRGGEAEVLASGEAAAGQPIAVVVQGSQLDPSAGTVAALVAVDDAGTAAVAPVDLVLADVDAFELGVGVHDSLAYDATRDELLVGNSQTGYVQVVDVDPDSASYGAVVAIVPPGPDVGPLDVAVTPDGSLGFNLNVSTLLNYDLGSFEFRTNQYIPGGLVPTSLAVAPDSSRLYIAYPDTLLFRLVSPSGSFQPIQGVGFTDALVEGGDVVVTPDGRFVLYAWFGGPNRALWIVGAQPASPDFHELLDQRVFPEPPMPEVFGPALPRVTVAPDSETAYVGNLGGVFCIELAPPLFPQTAQRSDLPFTGLVAVETSGEEFVLLTGPLGTLKVLDAELDFLGAIEIPGVLVDRSAVDRERDRLFLVLQQEASAGRLLVIPLR